MTDAASGLTAARRVGRRGRGGGRSAHPGPFTKSAPTRKTHMPGQRRGHTLQTRDLVAEAYLKLVNVQETG